MSVDHSIQLFFPAEQVAAALLATAEMADRRGAAECEVRLPGGRSLSLPFGAGAERAPVVLEPGGDAEWLSTCLLFRPDEAIRSYLQAHSEHLKDTLVTVEREEYASIGYIYLLVTLGKRYARLSFKAPGADMSLLFVASGSIQGRFLELLRTCEGVLGLIDVESGDYFLLEDPSRTIKPDPGRLAGLGWSAKSYIDPWTDTLLDASRTVE